MSAAAAVIVWLIAGCVAPPQKKPLPAEFEGLVEYADGQEVDYLSLAALMIRDGFFDRAEIALNEVDLTKEGLDIARYHTLRGLVNLHGGHYEPARKSFEDAVASGQTEPLVQVYIAQACYGMQDYQGVIDSLQRAGVVTSTMTELYKVWALCHWNLKQTTETFVVLERAERLFPVETHFTHQKLLYLLELELYREAAQAGDAYLVRAGSQPDAYLAVGEAFRRGKQHEPAQKALEMGRLRFPDNGKIRRALAYAYFDGGQILSAARVMEDLAIQDPAHRSEAIELYRRAGDIDRALYLNAQVDDPILKTRQRLSILLDAGRFEEAAALQSRIERLGLLDDQDVCYAMAFIQYRVGDYDAAESLLNLITKPELFDNRVKLIEAIHALRQTETEPQRTENSE